MVRDMYGDLLDGDDSSGYEYTEILGDGSDGDDILGELLGEIDGDDALGAFVGDEDRTAREAGGAEREAASRVRGDYAVLGQWRGRGSRRRRRLRRLVERSVRGDASATAKLQQVTARLTQRSQAGDQRATALLQQVQSWTATYQSQLTATPTQAANYVPGAPSPYVPPVATPTPATQVLANVTYPAPASQDYYDDDSGSEKRNNGDVDDY